MLKAHTHVLPICLSIVFTPRVHLEASNVPSAQLFARHTRRQSDLYMELIFDPTPWVVGLPHSIEAFFTLPFSSESDRRNVRDAHLAFTKQYGRAAAAPLLVYNFAADQQSPFSLLSGSS